VRYYDETSQGACGLMEWPMGLKEYKTYMGRADVKTAVHVPNSGKDEPWIECNTAVGGAFVNDKRAPSYKLLPELLSQIPIVLFK
jgi:carboxypeptidase D